jgi:hypothetical protein
VAGLQVLLGGGLAAFVAYKNDKQVSVIILISVGGLLAAAVFFFAGRFAWACCFGRRCDECIETCIAKEQTLEEQRQALEKQLQALDDRQQALESLNKENVEAST